MAVHEDPTSMSNRELRQFMKRRTPIIFAPEVREPASREISGAFRAVMFWMQYNDNGVHKKSIGLEDESGVFGEIFEARIVPGSVEFHTKMFDPSATVILRLVGADYWTFISGPRKQLSKAFEFIGVPLIKTSAPPGSRYSANNDA